VLNRVGHEVGQDLQEPITVREHMEAGIDLDRCFPRD
jgi:hypothetical protein